MSQNENHSPTILVGSSITKSYGVVSKKAGAQNAYATHDVSFTLAAGETLAVVGESGSGKSTLARIVVGLLEPTSGTVSYEGLDLAQMTKRDRANYRRRVQMIFQDPETSLSPRRRVSEIIEEAWIANPGLVERSSPARARRVAELLTQVGLNPSWATRYPHELSGGQRQRLGIARALALEPRVLVCDEPVSALDVSVQAQIINLFQQLKSDLGVSYLFITHDLGVVRHIADRTMVMKSGRVVESGLTAEVYKNPQDPYTRALLEAVPKSPPRLAPLRRMGGDRADSD